MDIFKILSRSTKQTRKPIGRTQSSTLPSAGTASNPQLYNDPVPQNKKRKLSDRKEEAVLSDVDDEEINFFAQAPKTESKQTIKREKRKKAAQILAEAALSDKTETIEPTLLDEDECKATLRSHRIKITLMSKPEPVVKRKKSKKRKEEEPPKKAKDEQKQIYPQPLTAFEDLKTNFGISKRLGENLKREGYKIPTEVQMGSLPLLLKPEFALTNSEEGKETVAEGSEVDLLTVAPTGSGKTLAFLIPVVNSMVQRRRKEAEVSHRLEAIIVAPTKELASQIVNEGRKLAIGTGIKVVGMVKGMRVVGDSDQVVSAPKEDASESESENESDEDDEADAAKANAKAAKRAAQPVAKADILVTTPLILLHALTKPGSKDKLPLETVRHLILDEADVLLDPLFRDQTLGIWESCVSPLLHVSLWSATMGSSIETLAVSTISSRRERLSLPPQPLIRLVIGLKDSAIPNITHHLIYAATEPGKLIGLRQLLHPTSPCLASPSDPKLRPPFLVFTQTIPRAIALHSELLYDIPAEAGGSSRLAVLHSDLSDSARSAIMSRFRNGEIWILITTDILSRGVDFRGINGVVNYDVPSSGASYIHRVGRTGRAGRDGGVAVTFYTKEDIPFVKPIANIIAASEKAAGKKEGEGVQKWLLDALPSVSKKDKKDLKMRGVEVRRAGLEKDGGKGGAKAKISTKSGYERKVENRKKGAVMGSRRRAEMEEKGTEAGAGSDGGSDFGGFDD
ncbi:hypothetical protein V501_02308 [Pseudogymnoascus sp. VKM F-4519 (FW-2642)]|nr:hypothetical protein V501_02308 [Pseudogymnoascus sp. VKM F-4519 (FW-2642)]